MLIQPLRRLRRRGATPPPPPPPPPLIPPLQTPAARPRRHRRRERQKEVREGSPRLGLGKRARRMAAPAQWRQRHMVHSPHHEIHAVAA